MTSKLRKRVEQAAVLLLAAALSAAAVPSALRSAQAAPMSEGVVCDTDPHQTFSLTAGSGYITEPDGNSIYMWSYHDTGESFQLPGPVLCVTAGQAVTVILRNELPEPTSIVFLGQNNVRANGAPAQPQFTGGSLTSLVQGAEPGGSITYTFTPTKPGTFLYQSGTNANVQNQMGLYGAMIVRPAGRPDQVNDRADSKFAYSASSQNDNKEYVYLLSEVDPNLHLAVERGQPVNWNNYRARYFLINGRSMPDTIAPNRAPWLPNQPYGSLVHIKPYDAQANPDPAVIRYLNAGTVNYPFHPHGSDERVINKDGRPLQGPAGQDLSYSKFLLDIAPGQTLDVLMTWRDAESWNAVDNPIPVQVPPLQDQFIGPGPDTWFSESPYLGATGPLPPGFTQNGQCGEYYHIAHNHALQYATNFGASFGGQMTLFRIDPPAGCPAP